MKPTWWPGKQHESFTEWAISQGIIPNGAAPARFPGRGLGMIATRNIKVRIPILPEIQLLNQPITERRDSSQSTIRSNVHHQLCP